jgi:hypothetical protein
VEFNAGANAPKISQHTSGHSIVFVAISTNRKQSLMNTIKQPSEKKVVRTSVKPNPESFVERQVIVHCIAERTTLYRIWETTYLICNKSGKRKKLLSAFDISYYPQWGRILQGRRFTLVFEGLDKDCKSFDLYEDIPQSGEFRVDGISRNKQDVYRIGVS